MVFVGAVAKRNTEIENQINTSTTKLSNVKKIFIECLCVYMMHTCMFVYMDLFLSY